MLDASVTCALEKKTLTMSACCHPPLFSPPLLQKRFEDVKAAAQQRVVDRGGWRDVGVAGGDRDDKPKARPAADVDRATAPLRASPPGQMAGGHR